MSTKQQFAAGRDFVDDDEDEKRTPGVHKPEEIAVVDELLEQAEEAESLQRPDQAIEIYLKIITQGGQHGPSILLLWCMFCFVLGFWVFISIVDAAKQKVQPPSQTK